MNELEKFFRTIEKNNKKEFKIAFKYLSYNKNCRYHCFWDHLVNLDTMQGQKIISISFLKMFYAEVS